jgi:Fe/S biogenesis protein NfuA
MLKFTEAARDMIRAFVEQDYLEQPVLRVTAGEGGDPSKPHCEFSLVEAWEREPNDVELDGDGFRVLVDQASMARLEGAVVDYVDQESGRGFRVTREVAAAASPPPASPPAVEGDVAERVRRVLDERINPAVAGHGGQISLVAVKDNIVYVEMLGGCQGCGMARMTLRQGVERMIRQEVPEIVEVQDVTDHVSGVNPYYQPGA